MIDMHIHLLFGADDGPKTIEETMRLLEAVSKEGVTDVISTSHALQPQYHVPAEEVTSQLRLLEDILAGSDTDITLHSGHEVRLTDDLDQKVEEGSVLTLAGSRYLLLELPSGSVPAYTASVIGKLLRSDITPIIAHPERNRGIAEKPERLERLILAGALSQITAGSLAGAFGKSVQKLSLQLVEANLVHCYGSDAHNLTTRPPLFLNGLDLLEKKKLGDYADVLLDNNQKILENGIMTIFEPEELTKPKKWLFF